MREPLDYLERFLYRVSGAQATVETARCLREHSGLSECDLCVKNCPVQSIDLRGGVHVLSHCTGCGVCVAVCPVSAFDLNGAAAGQLLSQAASILRRGRSLFFTCERSADVASADLVLPCLARLDETVVLGALALGAQKLSLTRGPCGACPYTEAMPRYRRTLDRMRRWSRALPRAAEIAEVGEGEESRERRQGSKAGGPDRRAFFAWVRSEGMQLMASVLDDFSEGLHGRRSAEGVSLPLRNRLLPHVLKKLGVGEEEIPYDPEGPWAELLLDEVKCNGGEACVRICPTKAIVRGEGAEVFRLSLQVSRCVNCALCLDACIPNALTYRQGLSLRAVAMAKPTVLVEKPYRRCSRCEARFLWSEGVESGELCSACHFLADLERSPTIPDGAGGAAAEIPQWEKERDGKGEGAGM